MRSNTIAETVKRTAKRTPHHTAIIYGERTWTYEQLDQAVTSVALELQNQGVNKGERVAAYGKNSDLYVLLYLAAVRLGAVSYTHLTLPTKA